LSERKFKVTVNGKTFIVQVEEIEEETKTPMLEQGPTSVSKPKMVESPSLNIPKTRVPSSLAPGVIEAPIPGVITMIKIEVGQAVKMGDPLLVLEAMKMENEIHSSIAGTVKKINVSTGDRVNKGDALVVIE
jgi:glutaconyl-CoA/methylmalonyl-CoA decarboxylase subunit gamma